MQELTSAEALYVDNMAGTIINGMIVKNPNSYNTEYFKMICQTAYQLALVMLEVRNERIVVTAEMSPVTMLTYFESLQSQQPATPSAVPEAQQEKAVAVKAMAAETKLMPKKKKGGRPKGSKNKEVKVGVEPLCN